MTTTLHRLAPLALLVPLVAATGCEVAGPMCTDLRRQVLDREQALPRDCQIDQECFIVETLPGRLVAASATPDDPELAVALATWRDGCVDESAGDEDRLVARVFDTRCQLYQGAESGTERRLCAITFEGELVDPNAPDFELPPDALCDCTSDADCAEGLMCEGNCQCLEPCAAACQHIDDCGEDALLELGFGGDLETCIATCEANLGDQQLREVEVPCLVRAECTEILDCIEAVPLP